MPSHRRLAAHEWPLYRELRLRALRDAPDAFGSTIEREEAFPESEWISRLVIGAGSPLNYPMVIEVAELPIGLAWVRIDPAHPEIATLYSVWIDPAYRGTGAGRMMLDAAIEWARGAKANEMTLSVTIGPNSAKEFYRSAGFVEFGEPEPLRPNSVMQQQWMRLAL